MVIAVPWRIFHTFSTPELLDIYTNSRDIKSTLEMSQDLILVIKSFSPRHPLEIHLQWVSLISSLKSAYSIRDLSLSTSEASKLPLGYISSTLDLEDLNTLVASVSDAQLLENMFCCHVLPKENICNGVALKPSKKKKPGSDNHPR